MNLLQISDKYNLEEETKWDVVRNHLDTAIRNDDSRKVFITFSSGYTCYGALLDWGCGGLTQLNQERIVSVELGGIITYTNPELFANFINPRLLQYTQDLSSPSSMGIVVMDFPSENLISEIIKTNFQ